MQSQALFLLVVVLLEFLPRANGVLLAPRRALIQHEQYISKRNLSDFFQHIPQECSAQCDVIVGAVSTCVHLDCACTVDYSNSLVSCVRCIVGLTPQIADINQTYQSILDEWKYSYCAQYYTPSMNVSDSTPKPSKANPIASTSTTTMLILILCITDIVLFLL